MEEHTTTYQILLQNNQLEPEFSSQIHRTDRHYKNMGVKTACQVIQKGCDHQGPDWEILEDKWYGFFNKQII